MGLPRYRIPQRRQPAPVNTMFKAQVRASRLTEAEIRETMDAVRHCATRVRDAIDAGALKRARELEAFGFLQLALAVQKKISFTAGFAVYR